MAFTKFIKIFPVFIASFTFFGLNAQPDQGEDDSNELPVLMTKQNINNIRFISDDGRSTYYQRRSGSLLLSTNYSVNEIIEDGPHTQYGLHAPSDTNKIVIEAKENYHTNLNLRSLNKIYLTERSGQQVQEVGEGQSAKLHLQGRWYSFFIPNENKIRFQNSESRTLRFNIKIQNKINPYFIPQVEMASESSVVYTDIGRRGNQAVIKYDRGQDEVNILLQTSTSTQHLNMCLSQNNLIIQEIGSVQSNEGSYIHKIPLSSLHIDHSETIYQSSVNDLGSLICSKQKEAIYFVKNTKDQTERQTSEVAKIDLTNNELTIETQLNFVSQIIKMDKSILVPFREEVYVLKGQSDFASLDLLQEGLERDQN